MMNYIESQLAVNSVISCLLKNDLKTSEKTAQELLTIIYNEKFPALNLSEFAVIKSTTEMIALLNQHSNEIIIAFNNSPSISDSFSDFYLKAKSFTENIKSLYPTSRLLLTGLLYGGTIAEFVNSNLNEKDPFSRNICVSFNPVPTKSIFIPNTNIQYYSEQKNVIRIETSYPNYNLIANSIQNSQGTPDTHKILNNLLTLANSRGNQIQTYVGGVDLALPIIKELTMNEAITGISVAEFECYYITEENTEENGLLMSDLAVALLVTYSSITDTRISFSLDPYFPEEPYGGFLRKVYWPDFNENYPIIAGTSLGDVLFECDLWMKRMSLDTYSSEYPNACIPPRLRALGLDPIHNCPGALEWHRLWLVIESVSIEKARNAQENSISVKSVKIAVKSKQMFINANGVLEDAIDQFNDGGCIFAEKFTQLYEEISEEFPVFKRLKQVVRAIVLAEYMKLNHIPVDYQKVSQMLTNNVRGDDWIYSINSQYTEGDMNMRVFGGADLSIDNTHALLEEEFSKEYGDVNRVSNQLKITNVTNQPNNNQKAIYNIVPSHACSTCNQKLSLKEQIYSKTTMYCYTHNPDLCNVCLLPVHGNFLQISGKNYHNECVRCKICEALITSTQRHISISLGFIHADCFKYIQQKFKNINSQYENAYAAELEKRKKSANCDYKN